MEKRKSSYTIDENINWYDHHGEQERVSLKKKNKINKNKNRTTI